MNRLARCLVALGVLCLFAGLVPAAPKKAFNRTSASIRGVSLFEGLVASPLTASPYFASPTGTGSTCSSATPCALSTLLSSGGPLTPGDYGCMLGGTYNRRYSSTVTANSSNPITIGSCKSDGSPARWPTLPDGSANPDWAIIDGYWTATLATSINSSTTTVVLSSNVGYPAGTQVFIGGEQILLQNTSDGITFTSCGRGWSGTTAASHTAGDTMYTAQLGALTIASGGDYVYFRDFEVTNSNPVRQYNSDLVVKQVRGAGIYVLSGDHGKFLNLLLHDGEQGAYVAAQATNTEFYGDIIYNGGFVDWTRGHGQGLYMANDPATGQKQVRNVISFNSFTDGMKAYAESAVVQKFLFENIIAFNNGVNEAFPGNVANHGSAVGSTTRYSNIFGGTGSSLQPLSDILIHSVYLYHPFDAKPENGNLGMGYQGQSSAGFELTNSRIMGGNNTFTLKRFLSGTVTGNEFYEQTTSLGSVFNEIVDTDLETGYSFTWNSNTYFSQQPAQPTFYYPFRFAVNRIYTTSCDGGTTLRYTCTPVGGNGGWKENSGFDASGSSWTNAAPSGDEVFVIPNEYETGRGHGVCFNWSHASTCSFNLSTLGLVDGQTVYAYAAENPLGAPIATITYNAASPSSAISTAGTTVAAAVGYNGSIANGGMGGFIATTTRPEFAAIIFVPGDANPVAPDEPGSVTTTWTWVTQGAIANIVLNFTNPTSGATVVWEKSSDNGANWSTGGTTAVDATTAIASSLGSVGPWVFRLHTEKGGLSSANVLTAQPIYATPIRCYNVPCTRGN